MFACKNCGGNVKYDISSGQLACEYCHSLFDPYAYEDKTSDAEVQKNFDVTVFTCPQCGGGILSTDNTAAGFCSFCGASTILYSRISKENRPDYIIPFTKTKEDCKQAYSRLMAKAIFAPSELKDPQKIDSFRGIYMPYWSYYITQNGQFNIPASRSYRQGNYIITDHYQLNGTLDCYYKGLSYDASSSFADNISESLAPYDVKGMKRFTPAFLSGFYGDTADVSPDTYKPDAEQAAFSNTSEYINHTPAFNGFTPDLNNQTAQSLGTTIQEVNSAMFPVWFMSYRNKDRVAYATVNGQTGKVVTDIPISIKKFILGSFITAIPLYIILCLLPVFTPGRTMLFVGILAIAINYIYTRELTSVALKESGEDDTGPATPRILFLIIYLTIIVHFILQNVIFGIGNSDGGRIVWIVITSITMFFNIRAFTKFASLPGHKGIFSLIFTIVSLIYSTAIAFIQPIMDFWYYSGSFAIIIALLITLIDIVKAFNILSTRKLPQFSYTGGDNRA